MRTFVTTPTIVRQGPACAALPSDVRKRRPTALAVPKCLLANAALTIATGSLASRSSSVNVRPSSRFWPVTSKNEPVALGKSLGAGSPP